MKYVVNWIPLRIRFRSKNTQPHLNAMWHVLDTHKKPSDVRSLKESCEGNGNSHSHNSDTVMGMGREPGIFVRKKNCQRQPAIFFVRIASESKKVFLRGFWKIFFRCFDLPKTIVFSGQNSSNFNDLHPSPYILELRIISFSSKKVFFMVIVNIKDIGTYIF